MKVARWVLRGTTLGNRCRLLDIIMWFFQWNSLGVSLLYAFNASMTTGLVFGLMMSSWYKLTAKRKKLPQWADL
ncbi:DUF6404 family protein [Enterovibrio nigricans]|uniref:DUF6404 family protein n=1 Tax=Enterovibrio nigricans TaxID=504469 RepID=UPI0009999794|nr:DUF6404 family protein [Enterovibrio nigricans]PKF49838.1 hypothetical protein AT251_15980 [Enterovibrio nigricans]